jgi:hypothetical protein
VMATAFLERGSAIEGYPLLLRQNSGLKGAAISSESREETS